MSLMIEIDLLRAELAAARKDMERLESELALAKEQTAAWQRSSDAMLERAQRAERSTAAAQGAAP